MRPLRFIGILGFASLIASSFSPTACCQQPAAKAAATAVFNGRDLTGWFGHDPHRTSGKSGHDRDRELAKQQSEFQQHWSVENGELVNDGKGPYATSAESYGDIELSLEYKTVALADSGIYLRGSPQIQIWDTTKAGGKWKLNADKGSGGLFNNSKGAAGQLPLVNADRPFGEWNQFRIRQLGSRTTVHLNDQLVVDNAVMENYWQRKLPLPPAGPIHLQTHGGEIRWRNVSVKKIGGDDANRMLRGTDPEGFEPLLSGDSLDKWQGALQDYQFIHGVVSCKPGHGGVLFTKEKYGDFIARLEFKLPLAGNNGLAIRYSGKKDPAYHGMAELQVLDNTADRYKNLDSRQYHGSAYGMQAAHRGYLRPTGQWNYQEVTVKGSTIKVELNGTFILDVDLATIAPASFMDGKPHPGRDLKAGFFGFAGHSDPVEFRNVSIKRLE